MTRSSKFILSCLERFMFLLFLSHLHSAKWLTRWRAARSCKLRLIHVGSLFTAPKSSSRYLYDLNDPTKIYQEFLCEHLNAFFLKQLKECFKPLPSVCCWTRQGNRKTVKGEREAGRWRKENKFFSAWKCTNIDFRLFFFGLSLDLTFEKVNDISV